mgnify:FL=1
MTFPASRPTIAGVELSESDIYAAIGGLGLPEERLRPASVLLAFFLEHLWRSNARFGLISHEDAADPARLLDRHIVDSISVWRQVEHSMRHHGTRRLVDLGTGAGLPGLPLACVLPDLEETLLVDRRGKRISFLLGVLPALQQLGRNLPEAFSLEIRTVQADSARLHRIPGVELHGAVVVFRAFQPTATQLLADLARSFPAGTPVHALKGRHAAAREELQTLERSDHAADAVLEELPPRGNDQAERALLSWVVRRERD